MNRTIKSLLVAVCTLPVLAALTVAAPVAKARVKVATLDGAAPGAEDTFVFGGANIPKPIQFKGSDWSEWLTLPLTETNPAPIVCSINLHRVTGAGFPRLKLSVEATLEGTQETSQSEAELHGPALGFIRWKEQSGDILHVDTFAGHNRRVYGETLKAAAIPIEQRPKLFQFGERWIGGDDDLINWRAGLAGLAGMGFNSIHSVPPPLAEETRRMGFKTVWGAAYNPPGYAFNFDANRHEQFTKFVEEQIAAPIAAGWKKSQIGFWFISDEPGWYYPDTYTLFNTNANASAAFRLYLRGRYALQPADIGKSSWDDDIKLIGRKQYTDLQSRRLYYWSNRFVPYASSVYFSEVTRAFEQVLGPKFPVVVNFNNFFGTFYQPGPIANNSAKTDPNAAMGQHDWLEFGRVRGATCISTEDWFGDEAAERWSFYASRLRSAAELSGVEFGSLVIPRTSGQKPMGMPQKLLSLVGHGAKTIKFFTFGPEYNFPGNYCWSENPAVYKPLSTALSMIARGEDFLYLGKPRPPQVAILTPQSSQLWDLEDQEIAKGLIDATNTRAFANRMQYLAEVWGLYNALQHSAVPVTFIDEDALTDKTALQKYKVIYVTAPDVPYEGMEGILSWVANGGTLVTVAGAGVFDRYHQPYQKITGASGITITKAIRPLAQEEAGDPTDVTTSAGKIPAFGGVEELTLSGATKVAEFDGGTPAITERTLAGGKIIRYAVFPGTSYVKSGNDIWRQLIFQPVRSKGVTLPVTVNLPKIEAPVLYSDAGAVATVLNWSGKSETVEIALLPNKPVKKVESVLKGPLGFRMVAGRALTRVPVDEVDVILFRY